MFGKLTKQVSLINHELVNLRMALSEFARTFQGQEVYQGLRDRLDSLEGPLQAKLGEVEGLLLKAEGMKHAARAAEERARGSLKRAEELTEEPEEEPGSFPTDGAAPYIPPPDAPRVPANPVLPVQPLVASRRR